MSLLSSLFPSTTPAPAPTPAAPAPTDPNAQQGLLPTPPVDESPLAEFANLWEPEVVDDKNKPVEPGTLFSTVDPAKMLAAAKKVNFAQSIPPEVLAKITAGGADAGAALIQVLNEVSQRSYAQATLAASKMIDTAVRHSTDAANSSLPSLIKKHAVSDSIREANPALQHPAAAPILQALESQFTVKYPNATVTEIKTLASNYLTQFGKVLTPQAAAPELSASEDWSKFM